jgi:hypothetical protein
VGERGGREGVAARENQMRKRGRVGAHGGEGGVPRARRARPDHAGLGQARSGHGSKTRGAHDHGSETNRESKSERGKTDARLNTTSDKRNMLRHDATSMSS